MNEQNCRSCGLYMEELPWGEDGKSPTFELCPCCGIEFGNEDYTVKSTRRYRENWINDGANWFDPSQQPEKWDIEEQFKNIPPDFL